MLSGQIQHPSVLFDACGRKTSLITWTSFLPFDAIMSFRPHLSLYKAFTLIELLVVIAQQSFLRSTAYCGGAFQGIDKSLDGVEKLSPKDRMSAHTVLDDLIKEAHKERYAKLMAPQP